MVNAVNCRARIEGLEVKTPVALNSVQAATTARLQRRVILTLVFTCTSLSVSSLSRGNHTTAQLA